MLATLALLAAIAIPPPPLTPTLPVLHGPAAPIDRALQSELKRGTAGAARIVVRAKPEQMQHVTAAVQRFGGTIVASDPQVRTVTARLDLRLLNVLRYHPAVASLSMGEAPAAKD